jgi:hypothetical protein
VSCGPHYYGSAGIDVRRLESMETRLKEDVLNEATCSADGTVLVAREVLADDAHAGMPPSTSNIVDTYIPIRGLILAFIHGKPLLINSFCDGLIAQFQKRLVNLMLGVNDVPWVLCCDLMSSSLAGVRSTSPWLHMDVVHEPLRN